MEVLETEKTRQRRRNTRRQERKRYKRCVCVCVVGGEQYLFPFTKLQITTVTADPMTHKITYQSSRNFKTFGSQSEIGSTFRHWTCALLELGSSVAITTPAPHMQIQGENHKIRIRGRRCPACRFSSEHKSAGRMGCEHKPDMKCSKSDGKEFIQKQKNKCVCVCVYIYIYIYIWPSVHTSL